MTTGIRANATFAKVKDIPKKSVLPHDRRNILDGKVLPLLPNSNPAPRAEVMVIGTLCMTEQITDQNQAKRPIKATETCHSTLPLVKIIKTTYDLIVLLG